MITMKTNRRPQRAIDGGRISRPTLYLILAGIIMLWGAAMVLS
jgi:hypothetical protein